MSSNNTDSNLRDLIRKALQRTGISMRQASLAAGMSRAQTLLAAVIIVLVPSLSGAQQVDATMPKDHNGQAIWCSGFFVEIKHQAMDDNNPMIFDWANTQLTHLQHEAAANPARATASASLQGGVIHEELQNGQRVAGAGLWELNGYSPPMSDREFILMMRRPDEDFCNQVAEMAATWEGEYARMKSAGMFPQ